MTNIHPIDDYNSRILWELQIIGTVTTNIGNPAPRHGWKLLIEYD